MCVLILSGRHRSNRNQCHIGTEFRYPTLTVICTLCQTKFKISPKYFEFELHLQLSSQVQLIRPMSAGHHIAKASKALFWNEIITADTKLKKLTTAQLNRWKLRETSQHHGRLGSKGRPQVGMLSPVIHH